MQRARTGGARAPRSAFLVLFLGALALRAAYFLEFRHSPYARYLLLDARSYDLKAQAIASGHWLGDRIFYQDPLYPYLLAAFYALFGHHTSPVLVAQTLIGAALPLLVVLLAWRAFAGTRHAEAIAWLAGATFALATPLVFFEQLLIKTSLGLALTVVHLLALAAAGDAAARGARRAGWGLLGAGALLGLNLLDRGNYALLAPPFALWLGWRLRGAGGASPRPLGAVAAALALYTAGAVAVVAPVTVRNWVVGHELVLVTSQGGQNFYLGNGPWVRDGSYAAPPWLRPTPIFEEQDFLAQARRDTGRELGPSEASRHFFRLGLEWIRDHPRAALANLGRKVSLWLSGAEIPDNYDFRFVRDRFAPVLALPLATGYTFGLLGWAVLIGALLAPRAAGRAARAFPNAVLIAGFALVYSASIWAFFVFGRYRIPIYPALVVLAAAGVVHLATGGWRRAAARRRASIGLALAIAAVLVLRPLWQPGWPRPQASDDAVALYDLGRLMFRHGDPDAGLAYFTEALAGDAAPAEVVSLIARDRSWRRRDRPRAAAALYRRLLARIPESAALWREYASLLTALGDAPGAARARARAAAVAPAPHAPPSGSGAGG